MIEIYLAGGCFAVILLLMAWRRTLARLAVRNFLRRRRQVAIATAGLLIGTAIISSSMVITDTMGYIFVRDVAESLDLVDETVTIPFDQEGGSGFFPYRFYEALSENLDRMDGVDAISPEIVVTTPVSVPDLGQMRSGIQVIGCNYTIDRAFGPFYINGKETYFEALGDDEALLNMRAADDLGAKGGDVIILFGERNMTFRVRDVVDDSGKANYLLDRNVFITLPAAQNLTGRTGKINMVKISNTGGVLDGASPSSAVRTRVQEVLTAAMTPDDIGIYSFSEDGFQNNLILFSSFGVLDPNLVYALTSDPNITSRVDMYATYFYIPSIEGYMEVVSLQGANGSRYPIPLTAVDRNNDAFGPYHTIDNRSVFTTGLGVTNGSYDLYLTQTVSILTGLYPGDRSILALRTGGIEVSLPVRVKEVVLDHPGSGNGAFPPILGGGAYIHRDLIPELNYTTIVRYSGSDAREIDAAARSTISRSITYESMGFVVSTVKDDGLTNARESSEQIGEIFLILGLFSILAGMILVVNIFTMLGEERKRTMGVERAIGMQRSQLIMVFLFEGLLYALLASFAGAILGIVIGWAIIYSFGVIFAAGNLVFMPVVRPESLTSAFLFGALLTLATVAFASIRISRLNIVRAIRDIPEPPVNRRSAWVVVSGIVLVLTGALLLHASMQARSGVGILIGPSLIALGISTAGMYIFNARASFTLSGAFMIFWILGPFSTSLLDSVGAEGNIELFAGAGILLVIAGIIIVMFNSDAIIDALVRLASGRRSLRAVIRIALSYPMRKKFRTANTLLMFATVIFTVVSISMITSMQESLILTSKDRLSGGYDVIAMFDISRGAPADFVPSLGSAIPSASFSKAAGLGTVMTEISLPDGDRMVYPLRGGDAEFFRTNEYTFTEMLPGFGSPDELWAEVQRNASLVVVDGSFAGEFVPRAASIHAGDEISLRTSFGQEVRLKVGGVMNELFVVGVFTTFEALTSFYPNVQKNVYLLGVERGSPTQAGKDIENRYALDGVKVIVIADLIDEFLRITRSIMMLVQAFLAIGLIVGIAGLGVITVREVAERRQEIGMLKAMGFTDRMVFQGFLIQTSFITLLGILLGVSLGIGLSWKIFDRYFSGSAEFVIPWAGIGLIVGLSYFATLVSTLSPAYKASRTPPAEALRYVE